MDGGRPSRSTPFPRSLSHWPSASAGIRASGTPAPGSQEAGRGRAAAFRERTPAKGSRPMFQFLSRSFSCLFPFSSLHFILLLGTQHRGWSWSSTFFFKMTIIRSQRHGNGGGGDRNSWDVGRLRKTTYHVRRQALFTRYYYALWSGSTVHRPCGEDGEGRGSLGGCTQ